MIFLINVLHWIAAGLFTAYPCVMVKAKKNGEEMSGGSTWLVPGNINTAFNLKTKVLV